MKASVNKETCIGCGTCNAICPDIFKLGDDGKASVISDNYTNKEDLVRQARDACPVQAISIEE